MLQPSPMAGVGAIETVCTSLPRSARSCSASNFGILCRAAWPDKTAEHLASEARCAVRTAAYYLSGKREPSKRAYAALMAFMFA